MNAEERLRAMFAERAARRPRFASAVAPAVVFVVVFTAAAYAETYDLGFGQIGTNGSDAEGTVAVSDTGNARGRCIYGGSLLGCLTGPGVVASGTGGADGGVAASGTGTATASGLGWGAPAVAVSGTGCATGWDPYNSDRIAVSGTGCATGTSDPFWQGYAVSLSGGDATGHLAVSVLGNADSRGQSTTWHFPVATAVPGAAVSPTGSATGSGAVAVAGGNAAAYGGLLCVSATGDCRGASVYNVCPMGYCE